MTASPRTRSSFTTRPFSWAGSLIAPAGRAALGQSIVVSISGSSRLPAGMSTAETTILLADIGSAAARPSTTATSSRANALMSEETEVAGDDGADGARGDRDPEGQPAHRLPAGGGQAHREACRHRDAAGMDDASGIAQQCAQPAPPHREQDGAQAAGGERSGQGRPYALRAEQRAGHRHQLDVARAEQAQQPHREQDPEADRGAAQRPQEAMVQVEGNECAVAQSEHEAGDGQPVRNPVPARVDGGRGDEQRE
ncbi:conserved hypothetical protein [Ricinus communis]|uniref:Uncharacterized protein n=1 Tax=Ricinus communis TaxID=3988 RepID=B9TJ80_RICCO|nr:conserved hypothetical protein [Ricinus communis]